MFSAPDLYKRLELQGMAEKKAAPEILAFSDKMGRESGTFYQAMISDDLNKVKFTGKEFVVKFDNDPFQTMAKQFYSSNILAYQLNLKAEAQNKDIIAYCVEQLVQEQSPDADMISRSLEKLNGYWSQHKIGDLAQKTVVNTKQWQQHEDKKGVSNRTGSTCTDCDEFVNVVNQSANQKYEAIGTALRRLEALSN